MGWFERQSMGRTESEIAQTQGRYLRAARVDQALETLAGPFGVRRFVVRFAEQNGRVRVQRIEAMPLKEGGGPPPPDPRGQRQAELEKALNRLHRNMSVGPRWKRGVLGYIRDRSDAVQLFPLFDEDVDIATLEKLPLPPPPGHPLEDPAYRKMIDNHEPRMARLQARTAMIGGGWDLWELDEGRLRLHYPDEVRRHRCRALGTLQPERGRFLWAVDEPLFSAPPAFTDKSFSADWNAANELGLLTTARLDGDWLFVGDLEDGRVLFATVF